MESTIQAPINFSRAMQEYLSVKIDPDNFDPTKAADKFEAFYKVHNMFSERVNAPTNKELNFFGQIIEGSDGRAKFLSGLNQEQISLMEAEIKRREKDNKKQS
jgi:hypothetical protein